MTKRKRKTDKDVELKEEELERQKGDPLPDREVLSVLYPQPIPPDDGGLFPTDPVPKGFGGSE